MSATATRHRAASDARPLARAAAGAIAAILSVAPGCAKKHAADPPAATIVVPPSTVYDDLGPAPPTAEFRGLIALPTREPDELEKRIDAMYTPSSPSFRSYMKLDEYMARYAPAAADVAAAKGWFEQKGFTVERIASNRMLIEFSGTIAKFNATFGAEVHLYQHKGDGRTKGLSRVYAPPKGIRVPHDLASFVDAILCLDLPPDPGTLSKETGDVATDPPPDLTKGLVPSQIVGPYGFDRLAAAGGDGSGTTIGILVADSIKLIDMQSFWQTFGVTRDPPVLKDLMEPASTRIIESTLDVEWAGILAPKANLIVYQTPDIRDTSMLYGFNEAVGLAEANVITDSFGHRETSISRAVEAAYDDAARMAAALGITVVAATGDSGGVDVPSVCPYVTAVGGTSLAVDPDGKLSGESAWFGSGSGPSRTFDPPAWQKAVDTGGARGVADVAMNAESYYFVYFLGDWDQRGGTSFASPIFAALVADADSWRTKNGKGLLGYLNPVIYEPENVRGVFRDIVVGTADTHQADIGWDYATGWGSPDAMNMASNVP